MNIRPMLAAKFKDEKPEERIPKMRFPVLCSPKIDGIRWMKPSKDVARTRTWTPLPNKRFQDLVKHDLFDWLDGEVVFGKDPTIPGIFNKSQSCIMTADSEEPFSLWVFDFWQGGYTTPFSRRLAIAKETVEYMQTLNSEVPVGFVEHKLAHNAEEVFKYEQEAIEAGFEGLMFRDPQGFYKYGRSTLKEQGLVALKRFEDDEAQVIGFEALERNTNPQTRNSFGLAKRSSSRSGKMADNLLGRLLVRHPRYGDFAIGSGFDEETRIRIWENQASYEGRWVTYKYQNHGTLNKPRMPIFKGFRSEIDI